MTASVEFRSVTKRFGPVTAVGDISFTVAAGETARAAAARPRSCG